MAGQAESFDSRATRAAHDIGHEVDAPALRRSEVEEDAQSAAIRALRVGSVSGAVGSGDADTVHAYLREIGRVSLLSADLEVICARRIERGHEAEANLAAWAAEPERG
ncbi:MAG TPA: sigma-70 factor domain-containing protein, partial [Acidimicrobiales bacterium]|nr:sigma-70 factor domain-containing protein [Acidimicrobiales bacterium]